MTILRRFARFLLVAGFLSIPQAALSSSSFSSPADSTRRVHELRRLVRNDRLDLESRRELADLLARSGKIELRREAFDALSEALLIDDTDPDLWIRMARLQELRGYRESARNAYHTALEMAPHRSDLWNELAEHEFQRFQRRKRDVYLANSLMANQQSLVGDPQSYEALRRSVRIAYILGDTRGVDSLCSRWEAAWPEEPWPHFVRGMLHCGERAWQLAGEAFRTGLTLLPKQERKPFLRLDIVDPKREEERQRAAPDTAQYLSDYWKWRDPTPADMVNPRLLEHYARMVKAELLFALDHLGVRGWDHAPGEMIVRYGIEESWKYDVHVRRIEEYRVSSTFAAPTIEVAYGPTEDMVLFQFVDYNMSGRFFNPIEAFPRDEDFFLVTTPSEYHPPLNMPEFKQEIELWRYRDEEGHGRIEVTVALPPDQWPPEILDKPHRLASKITLYDVDWEQADGAVASWARFKQDPLGRLVGRFELAGTSDSLIVGLETQDREKAGRAAGFATLSPRSFRSPPSLSEIAFLSQVDFGPGGGMYAREYGSGLPNPGHRYRIGDPVGIAFQAYGLGTEDGECRARLRITVGRETRSGFFNVLLRRGQNPPEAELVFDTGESGPRLSQLLAIEVPELEPGVYELRVSVEDLIKDRTATTTGRFVVLEPGKIR